MRGTCMRTGTTQPNCRRRSAMSNSLYPCVRFSAFSVNATSGTPGVGCRACKNQSFNYEYIKRSFHGPHGKCSVT